MGLLKPKITNLEKNGDIDGLVKALKYERKFDVRASAAESLGRLEDKKAVEPLITALKDKEPYVQECARRALEKIGESAVESLIQGLDDEDDVFRAEIVKSLRNIKWEPKNDVEKAYYSFINMEWSKLMKLGEPAVEPLILVVKYWYMDDFVRRDALLTLRKIGGKRAIEGIMQSLESTSTKYGSEYIPLHVTSALARMGEPAIEPLIRLMKHEYHDIRDAARLALPEIGERAIESLVQALKNENKFIRANAAEALGSICGKIREKSATEPLIQALKDEDSDVREKAAEALGRIKDTRAVEPLIQALKSENRDIRFTAAEALGRIKDTRAVEPLIQVLKDKEVGVRAKTAAALGDIRDKRAVESLIQALKDEYPMVKRNATDALGQIKDKKAIEPLIRALKDKTSDNVREGAAEALKRITKEDFWQDPERWQNWWEENKERFLRKK